VKFVRPGPDPDGCASNRRRVARAQAEMQRAPKPPAIATARMRRLAQQIHTLGPRPLYEPLKELQAGAPLEERLERYAALSEMAPFIRALGGDRLPVARLAARRKGPAP
jgi:hypothetical protein